MGDYGHFSDDGLEYVVTTPHTPRDWFNFFWNPTYLACAAQNMNGFSLFQSEEGVVTNLFGKQDERDSPRWIYVRDRDTGEFWSVGFLPCGTGHNLFECRHGLGYTILRTRRNGVETAFRLFVPRKHAAEIWTIEVSNRSDTPRNLSVFSVAEIRLDGMHMPFGYLSGLSAEFLPEDNLLLFRNRTWTVTDKRYRAFLYSDRRIRHWDASRAFFLGPRRDYARPERVERGRLGRSNASVEPLLGAVQHDLRIPPGRSRRWNIVLGLVHDLAEARRVRKAFAGSKEIEAEFEAVKKGNVRRLGRLRIETPDPSFDHLFNVWLKHQLHLMADWARFYFKGFRDTCQDAAGMSILDPGRAREMLARALRNQRSDGFCPRAFRVASLEIAAADKHYADSPSWIAHATDAVLRETGDLSLLDETVPYSDSGEGTVWEHNLRAMEFLWNDRGPHGLSLIHHGDWNDLMDHVGPRGRGEGVWMSLALARVLRLVGRMAEWKGDRRTARLCARRFRRLRGIILEHGRDGDRFLYAINDEGRRIGSRRSGRIFINPQSWAMLSGVVDARQYARIARKMEEIVETPVGPVHHWPPYTKYDPGIGQITGIPPGFATNGNVYCHAAAFKIAADFEAGRIEKAWETLQRILPDETRSEPYAQANGYVGPTALRTAHHVSDDPWRSGTVAWNFLNVFDRMLGFRRTFDGFRLRPRIPAAWNRVRFVRPFRGILFEIEIRRGAGPQPRLLVDGVPVEGDFVPVAPGDFSRRRIRILCTLPREGF